MKLIDRFLNIFRKEDNVSDSYHTFKELYNYRLQYNAAFFNMLALLGVYDVHKSYRHSNGELPFGGGWFIVVAELPSGQISNHYRIEDWDKFHIPEKVYANKWDGHSGETALYRLNKFNSFGIYLRMLKDSIIVKNEST